MKKLLLALVFITALATFTVWSGGLALAAPKDDVCTGVALTGGSCDTTTGPSVEDTITTVINIFSFVVGVTAVIMVIVGGFRYVISSGDSNSTNGAKNTILYALVGLVVVALAQVIVRFVVTRI